MRFAVAALSAVIALRFGGPSFARDRSPIQPLAERVYHVSRRGAIGFAAVSAGLSVIDLSRPQMPKILPRVETAGGYANKVTIHAGRLLVANDAKGVLVLELTDPIGPSGAR